MSNGNQNHNSPQSRGKKCARGVTNYNTSGRQLTRDDFLLCPRNVEYSYNQAAEDETSPYHLDEDITASDFSESNNSNSSTPPVARGHKLNVEHEIQRYNNSNWQRLFDEKAAASCNRPLSPLRLQKTAQQCPNNGVTKNEILPTARSRGPRSKNELQRHQSKSSTCLPQNCRNIRAGRCIDLDRFYYYNMHAHTPPGIGGRPLDVQRDINLPTPKGQRATSCSTSMQYAQHQGPLCPQSFSSTSPGQSIATRNPVKDISITAQSLVSAAAPIRRVHNLSPHSVTTTTNTKTITPPHSSSKIPNRFTEKSPDKSQKQDFPTNSSLRQLMDEAYKDSPPKGFATPPAYKTPPRPSHITAQSASFSFQRPDNSNMSYVPQTPIGNNMFKFPQMETTPQQESINIHTPPRPNTMTTDTILPEVAYETPSAYKTPPQSSNIMTQLRSPLLQKPENSNVSYVAQTPQSPSARWHDRINIPTLSKPNTMINETTRPQVETPNISPQQPSPPTPSSNDSASYNDSMFIEPSSCENRRQIKGPATTLKSLTADLKYQNQSMDSRSRRSPTRCATTYNTQYRNETMDCSGRESPTRAACPIQHDTRYTNITMDSSGRKSPSRAACAIDNFRTKHCQEIPPEHTTCDEYQDQNLEQDLNSSTLHNANLCHVEDTLEPEFESTPRKLFCSMETQSESNTFPSVSLFRSVAKKLNATYDFLSSFVTTPQPSKSITLPPESSQPRWGQFCDATDLSTSLQECANAQRCGRIQFNSSDKQKDPNRTSFHKIQIENLVNDTYCPGIIQDTIDGRKDFNNHSFNMTLQGSDFTTCDGPPEEEPMTLLEAFSIRIEKERSQIENQLTEDFAEEQINETIQTHFANQYSSDLNHSIKCLLLSERIQEHKKAKQAKEKSFEADVQRFIKNFPDNLKIKLYVYMGLTKPAEEPSE